MTTCVTVGGHPLHPMLVTLPIGLWVFSLVCDFVFVSNGDTRWETTAYFTLGGGIAGALLAAIPGSARYRCSKSTSRNVGAWRENRARQKGNDKQFPHSHLTTKEIGLAERS